MCKVINRLAFLCGVFSNLYVTAQSIKVKEIGVFSSEISEASGLEITPEGKLWTHNDGGDKPQIYLFDTTGTLLKTVYLKNVEHEDFEDLTQDDEGNLYIGDFGNNLNARENLRIYKIKVDDSNVVDTLVPEVINFTFPDQKEFPPPDNSKNFDCEGLVFFKNNLHVFSKNRGHSVYTKHYKIPKTPGNHVAFLVDSFATGGWIIGADLHKDPSRLVLTSNQYLWIFHEFSGEHFFDGKALKLSYTQREYEGVVFKDKDWLYLTNDDDGKQPSHIYKINISPYVGIDEIRPGFSVKLFPNPVKDHLMIAVYPQLLFTSLKILVLSVEGKRIKTFTINRPDEKIDLYFLKPGTYILQGKVGKTIAFRQTISKL